MKIITLKSLNIFTGNGAFDGCFVLFRTTIRTLGVSL